MAGAIMSENIASTDVAIAGIIIITPDPTIIGGAIVEGLANTVSGINESCATFGADEVPHRSQSDGGAGKV
jgi:hypothetical protein